MTNTIFNIKVLNDKKDSPLQKPMTNFPKFGYYFNVIQDNLFNKNIEHITGYVFRYSALEMQFINALYRETSITNFVDEANIESDYFGVDVPNVLYRNNFYFLNDINDKPVSQFLIRLYLKKVLKNTDKKSKLIKGFILREVVSNVKQILWNAVDNNFQVLETKKNNKIIHNIVGNAMIDYTEDETNKYSLTDFVYLRLLKYFVNEKLIDVNQIYTIPVSKFNFFDIKKGFKLADVEQNRAYIFDAKRHEGVAEKYYSQMNDAEFINELSKISFLNKTKGLFIIGNDYHALNQCYADSFESIQSPLIKGTNGLDDLVVNLQILSKANTIDDIMRALHNHELYTIVNLDDENNNETSNTQNDKTKTVNAKHELAEFSYTQLASSDTLVKKAKISKLITNFINKNAKLALSNDSLNDSDVFDYIKEQIIKNNKLTKQEQDLVPVVLSDFYSMFKNLYLQYSDSVLDNMHTVFAYQSAANGRFKQSYLDYVGGLDKDATIGHLVRFLHDKMKTSYGKKGEYYTINVFNADNNSRTANNVKGYNSFFIDFDIVKALKDEYKDKFKTGNLAENADFVHLLITKFVNVLQKNAKLPEPSDIVLSGHGLQFIWNFEKPNVDNDSTHRFAKKLNSNIKMMAHYVDDAFIKYAQNDKWMIEHFGDSIDDLGNIMDLSIYDAARVFRMPLSFNNKFTKNQDIAFIVQQNGLVKDSNIKSLQDFLNYYDITFYTPAYTINAKKRSVRKSNKTNKKARNRDRIKYLAENHEKFDKVKIFSEKELLKANGGNKDVAIKLPDKSPIKQAILVAQNHLSQMEDQKLLDAKHRSNLTQTRFILNNNGMLLGKIDATNMHQTVLGTNIHVAHKIASLMKEVYDWAKEHKPVVPQLLPDMSSYACESSMTNADSVQAIFSQSYYANYNIVRTIQSVPAIINYWNLHNNKHFRNNLLSGLAIFIAQEETIRLVLPNVDKLAQFVANKEFSKAIELLQVIALENQKRKNLWELELKKINGQQFSKLSCGPLHDKELNAIINFYSFAKQNSMAMARITLLNKKANVVQHKSDEWYIARGLGGLLDPYRAKYRNPFNSKSLKETIINNDGVEFTDELVKEIELAKNEGYYDGLTDNQITQKITQELVTPYLYCTPKNEAFAKDVENILRQQQIAEFENDVFFTNEILNYPLKSEMNQTKYAKKVHNMTAKTYRAHLANIGGQEIVEQSFNDLIQLHKELFDDIDLVNNDKAQSVLELMDSVVNPVNKSENTYDIQNMDSTQIAVLTMLATDEQLKKFCKQHDLNEYIPQTTVEFMHNYIRSLVIDESELNDMSKQRMHMMQLMNNYDLNNYIYSYQKQHNDAINTLWTHDLNSANKGIKQEIISWQNKYKNNKWHILNQSINKEIDLTQYNVGNMYC